jgi:hypothetical protein
MRLSPLFFSLALAATTSGCVTQNWVYGSTSYTSSPSAAASTGALPTTALLCSSPRHILTEYVFELGPGCRVLLDTHGREGTLAQIVGDRCDVAGSDGVLSIDPKSVTAQLGRKTIDLTIGGTSRTDGRYITYRFTGTSYAEATNEACEAVIADLRHRPQVATRD